MSYLEGDLGYSDHSLKSVSLSSRKRVPVWRPFFVYFKFDWRSRDGNRRVVRGVSTFLVGDVV